MTFNPTNGRESMSNQYPQTATHELRTELNPLFSSLRPMNSKKKALRVNFAFCHKHYLPDG